MGKKRQRVDNLLIERLIGQLMFCPIKLSMAGTRICKKYTANRNESRTIAGTSTRFHDTEKTL